MYDNNEYIIDLYNYVKKSHYNAFYIYAEEFISSLYSHLKNEIYSENKYILDYIDKQNHRILSDKHSLFIKCDYRITILEEMIRAIDINDNNIDYLNLNKDHEIYKKYIRAKNIIRYNDMKFEMKELESLSEDKEAHKKYIRSVYGRQIRSIEKYIKEILKDNEILNKRTQNENCT